LAYHSRDCGRSTSCRFVLAHGVASVDFVPARERIDAFIPQAERYIGEVKRRMIWDWLLHEYYFERVFVDVAVVRLTAWPDLDAVGVADVQGLGPIPDPAPQTPRPRARLLASTSTVSSTGSRGCLTVCSRIAAPTGSRSWCRSVSPVTVHSAFMRWAPQGSCPMAADVRASSHTHIGSRGRCQQSDVNRLTHRLRRRSSDLVASTGVVYGGAVRRAVRV
jgi:hypothetical protein